MRPIEKTKPRDSGFSCGECGHKFKTVAAAERAAYITGCPKCGGADINETYPGSSAEAATTETQP